MKQYNEVFELIENGEWDLTDFSVWLNDYNDQAWDGGHAEGRIDGYREGYEKGYDQCNEDISMGSV